MQEQSETGLTAALARIGDRWSLRVVNALFTGPMRFNELQDELGDIASNVLSTRLKNLEHLGLVVATHVLLAAASIRLPPDPLGSRAGRSRPPPHPMGRGSGR